MGLAIWLPRQDSNLKCLNQNQECCHYTTGDRRRLASCARSRARIGAPRGRRAGRACTADQISNTGGAIRQRRPRTAPAPSPRRARAALEDRTHGAPTPRNHPARTALGACGAVAIGSGAWEIRETSYAGA